MRRRGTKAALRSLIIAFILVLILLAAGTILRMQSRDMALGEAFVSFVSDTFGF